MNTYQVVADGNIGLVYNGDEFARAVKVYKAWCKHSAECLGYSSVRHVILVADDRILSSYLPALDMGEDS